MAVRKKTKESKLKPFEQVYEIVRQIPRGKVCTYGQISERMNRRLSAAAVGWAMNGLGSARDESGYTSNNVPWHRVINSQGKLSTRIDSGALDANGRPENMQKILLEKEGVKFQHDDSIDLKSFLWDD